MAQWERNGLTSTGDHVPGRRPLQVISVYHKRKEDFQEFGKVTFMGHRCRRTKISSKCRLSEVFQAAIEFWMQGSSDTMFSDFSSYITDACEKMRDNGTELRGIHTYAALTGKTRLGKFSRRLCAGVSGSRLGLASWW